MLDRLVGLETEYAFRFHPRHPGGPRPTVPALFDRLLQQLRSRVPVVSALIPINGWFLGTGGAVRLERIPYLAFLADHGLAEGATPECRGPRQLLRFQRAQDLLLSRAAAAAGGDDGTAALVKHNRDGDTSYYGSHENYETVIASGAGLWLWRIALVVLAPVLLALAVAAEMVAILVLIPFWVSFLLRAWRTCLGGTMEYQVSRGTETALRWLFLIALLPVIVLREVLLGPLAFRRQRHELLSFLVSRPIIAGAGTVLDDGRFVLSARAPTIVAVSGTTTGCGRPIYYTGHVIKAIAGFLAGDPWSFFALFRQRQRLQITLGDSNMAQTAEYLKIGTTLLVLDAIEAGALADAPRLLRPISALQSICADPELSVRVRLNGGRRWTALEIQRFYLETCRRFVAGAPEPHPEADEVLRLWQQALDALEDDPRKLIGKVDWITKRYFLEALGPAASLPEKRKLDLRYHELSREGYYLQMEAAGAAPTLVEPEEVLAATQLAPEGTPAAVRGRLIREFAGDPPRLRAGWASVVITENKRTRVVRLS